VHPVIHWLMTDARRRVDASEFLEAFALELRSAGVDVSRVTTGVPILHPQIFSFSGLWELDNGTTERLYRAGPSSTATMSNSPIRIAHEGGGPVRCDLRASSVRFCESWTNPRGIPWRVCAQGVGADQEIFAPAQPGS
jgi:adenylate cyclase